jgi:Putative Ig domain
MVVAQEGGYLLYVPTDLRVANVDGREVMLQWDWSAEPPAGGFVVEGGVTSGQTLASIVTGPETLVGFAAPEGSFFVRVHAVADLLRERSSNEVPLHVNAPVAPSPPLNLLGAASGDHLDLAWTNTFAGGPPTGLTLHVTGALATTIPLGLTDGFSYTGVPPGTYAFTVTASNRSGNSAASNPVTLTFPGGCSGVPLAPVRLGATHRDRVVTVRWDSAASGPAPSDYVLRVSELGLIIPTGRRLLSGSVAPGTYTLSVAARNPCGMSAWSELQVIVP